MCEGFFVFAVWGNPGFDPSSFRIGQWIQIRIQIQTANNDAPEKFVRDFQCCGSGSGGSVINRPPRSGSVIQDYRSPDSIELYTDHKTGDFTFRDAHFSLCYT